MLFLPYRKINRIFLSLHVTVKAKLKAKFVKSLADRRLSVSRDKKGNLADFKINFMRRLIFTVIKECKIKLILLNYQNTFRKLNVNRTRCTGKRVYTR